MGKSGCSVKDTLRCTQMLMNSHQANSTDPNLNEIPKKMRKL